MKASLLIYTIVAVLALPTRDAGAIPRMGRLVEGTLRDVNHEEKTAVIAAKSPLPISLVSRTVIFKDGVKIQPSELKSGMRVKAFRHVPVFGPPFVTRIVVLAEPSKCARCGKS